MLSATVIGRLGKDAETRAAGSTQVCNFTVATDHGFGDKKITTWVSVSVFGKQAEWLGQNLKKGDRVAATGKAYLRKWEGNGKSGAEFSIDATDVEKQWDKKEGEGASGSGYGGARGGGSTGYGGGSGGTSGGSSGGGGAETPPYTPDSEIPF